MLTVELPNDPHFWHHRGRYLFEHRKNESLEQAEKHLQRAIELSEHDSIHHHQLGRIRRERLRRALRAPDVGINLSLLERTNAAFEETTACFQKSRALAPDNIYPYVTHAQTILEVAKAFKESSGIDSIAGLPPDEALWFQKNLSEVHTLLADAETLYSQLGVSNTYVEECRVRLYELMGDLDEVVRAWELFNLTRNATPFSRRALSLAYLHRRKRDWNALSTAEIERIISNSADNILSGAASDIDYQLWFSAKLHATSFDPREAVAILSRWADGSESWRPYIYRYAVRFAMWMIGESDDDLFEEEIEHVRKRFHGRRNISFLWFGKSRNGFPLVLPSDLGEWDRKTENFFSKTAQAKLERVGGFISERPLRPQSGEIILDGRIKAFFVPGRDIPPGGLENQPITFFLGVSPEGIRAWKQEIGDVGGMRRISVGAQPPVFKLVQSQVRDRKSGGAVQERSSGFRRSIGEFAREYARQSVENQESVSLDQIASAVEAAFSITGSFEQAVGSPLIDHLRSVPDLSVSFLDGTYRVNKAEMSTEFADDLQFGTLLKFKPGGYGWIRAANGDKHFFRADWVKRQSVAALAKGDTVAFLPNRQINPNNGEAQLVARQVEIVEGEIPGVTYVTGWNRDQLRFTLESAVRDILTTAAENEVGITGKDLVSQLEFAFRGDSPLATYLGVTSLFEFLAQIPEIQVGRQERDPVVFGDSVPFGRAIGGDNPAPLTIESFTAWLHTALSAADAPQTGIPLTSIGQFSRKHFQLDTKIHTALGTRSLTTLLRSVSGVEVVTYDEAGIAYVRLAGAGSQEAAQLALPNPTTVTDSAAQAHLEEISIGAFTNWLIGQLADVPSDGMPLTEIGDQAREVFHLTTKVHIRLGYNKLTELIKALPDIEIVVDDGGTLKACLRPRNNTIGDIVT